jgi:hypothetical protein
MLGFMRTEWMPASLRALSAWDPVALSVLVFSSQGFKLRHTRVIELSCLSNGKTTTADDKNLLDINQVLASSNGSALKVRLCAGSNLGGAGCVADLQEAVGRSLGSAYSAGVADSKARLGRQSTGSQSGRHGLLVLTKQVRGCLAGQTPGESHG